MAGPNGNFTSQMFGSRDFDYLLNGFFRKKKHYFSREFTSSTIPGDGLILMVLA